MMIDVDSFKGINDHYGHVAGDQVLREIGHLLLQLTREGDTCCRYGGDEFTVLLPDTNLVQAFLLGERIRQRIAAFKFTNANKQLPPLKTQVSIGIAFLNNAKPNELIHAADLALFDAKFRKKNTTIVNCNALDEIKSCYECVSFKVCSSKTNLSR